MIDPFALPASVHRLIEATEVPTAATPVALRQAVTGRAAALAGVERPAGDIPGDVRGFVDKVAQHAYKVTDEDVEALAGAGYSEDQVFELTVCVALGASFARFERGLDALRKAGA